MWDYVDLVQEQPPRVKCTLCDHEFPVTGTRIANHLAKVGKQVKHCTGEVPEDACERCWSVYDFIHSARRNRLAPQRAEKLVRIHMNLRLVESNSDPSFEEGFIEWVEGSTGDM